MRYCRYEQNSTFEKFNLICRKQKKSESFEKFHADIVELASRADCGDCKDEWIRDMFTAQMNKEKNCRRHTSTNTESTRCLRICHTSGKGRRTQSHNEDKSVRRTNYNKIRTGTLYKHTLPLQLPKQSKLTKKSEQQRKHPKTMLQLRNHLQSCPAKDKICSKCAKRGYFAKVCRSTNVNYPGDRQEQQQEEIETERLETENDPVAFAEFTSNEYRVWDEYQIDKILGYCNR